MNVNKLFSIIGAATVMSLVTVSSAYAAAISVVPDATTVNIGDSVTVSILGSGFTSGGIDPVSSGYVEIGYGASTATVSNMTASTDFATWNLCTPALPCPNPANNTVVDTANSQVLTTVSSLSGVVEDAVTGTFVIATLSFIASSAGVVDLALALDPLKIWTTFLGGEVTGITLSGAQVSVSAVPIPPAIWLLGSGLVGLVGMARRKRNNAAVAV